jgi:putative sterol carrier protein
MSIVTPIAAAMLPQAVTGSVDSPLNPESNSVKEREMADAVKEFFANLESRADASKTAGMSNSYVFDIEGAGEWMVDVDDGKVTVTEGGGDADVVISTSEETFEKIVAGDVNPTSAYMTGKLKIKGDMGAAMKLQKLF